MLLRPQTPRVSRDFPKPLRVSDNARRAATLSIAVDQSLNEILVVTWSHAAVLKLEEGFKGSTGLFSSMCCQVITSARWTVILQARRTQDCLAVRDSILVECPAIWPGFAMCYSVPFRNGKLYVVQNRLSRSIIHFRHLLPTTTSVVRQCTGSEKS